VPPSCPITVFNLNTTGFSVLSEARFRSGERLEFRLSGIGTPSVHVTAAAVHTQSLSKSPGLYMTGFTFEPSRAGDAVPHAAIRELISKVAPAGFKI
jgi:hypothetical protein